MLHLLSVLALLLYLALTIDGTVSALRGRQHLKSRARVLGLFSIAIHTAALLLLFYYQGSSVWDGSGDYYFMLSWALAFFGLPLYIRLSHPVYLALIAGSCSLLLGGSSYLVHFQTTSEDIKFPYYLLLALAHIGPAILAQVALLISCAASILLLVQEARIKGKRFRELDTSPALSLRGLALVRTHLVLGGFGLMSLAIFSGALWSWFSGANWGYDPSRFLALGAWFGLAVLVQLQLYPHYSAMALARYTVRVVGLYMLASLCILWKLGGVHGIW